MQFSSKTPYLQGSQNLLKFWFVGIAFWWPDLLSLGWIMSWNTIWHFTWKDVSGTVIIRKLFWGNCSAPSSDLQGSSLVIRLWWKNFGKSSAGHLEASATYCKTVIWNWLSSYTYKATYPPWVIPYGVILHAPPLDMWLNGSYHEATFHRLHRIVLGRQSKICQWRLFTSKICLTLSQ